MIRQILKIGVLILLLTPLTICAQNVKSETINIEDIFKKLPSNDRKTLAEGWKEMWNSSFLTESERDTISVILKTFLDMRIPVTPETKSLVHCINTFYRNGEKENLNIWLAGLKKEMSAKDKVRTCIKDYLLLTQRIICEHSFSQENTHNWVVRGKYNWSMETGIKINIPEADIVCRTAKDSIFIGSSAVSYTLKNNYITGLGGKVSWDTEDSIYADLSAYRIEMGASEYIADSVCFHYPRQHNHSMIGKLKDNASKYDGSKNTGFPIFTSYSTHIKIDSIFPSVFYEGGVIYTGKNLSGFGTDDSPACLHLTPNDTMHMYIYSKSFSIDSVKIMAGMSRLQIPLDSGAVSHPEVNFAYIAKNRTAIVKRLTEQSLWIPFRDDYHQILLSVEQLRWPLDSACVELGTNSRSGLYKAKIESLNFFNENIYDKMQEMDEIHPLNGLLKASMAIGATTFSISDYAGYMKKPADQLRKQIVLLSYNDFVHYDEKEDEVTLKQRLLDYTQARVGKKDYDNICFNSYTKDSQTNALLNLKTLQLKVLGVEKLTISEKKDVYVEPSDKSVLMMKNRDMEFNGKLKAGMFDLYGNKLYFSYEKYAVDLTRVDSTGLYLADKLTKKRGERVNSLIRDLTGNIVIDRPDNKSGTKENEGFPVLHSTKDSYVYFDAPTIQNGLYKRDSFYFVLKPYSLKNINDADKFRYAFGGTLVSGILPDIPDTLLLMPDKTLGMNYETPKNGVALYGEGKLKNKVILNQYGLMADGHVDMNGASFHSKSILLLPDSMSTATQRVEIKKVEGKRPGVNGDDVDIKYVRKNKQLRVKSTTKPLKMYNDRIKYDGTLLVYQDLMDASGKLEMKDVTLTSKLFHLQVNNILSDRADMQLRSLTNENIRLNTSNVRADLDLANNKGMFVNNVKNNRAEFPANRYRCSFRSFTWYMNEAYLNIGIEDKELLQRLWKVGDVDSLPPQGKNIFVSTDKASDSLSFVAPLAKYNLTNGDIRCSWVNHIELANGRFYPLDGEIFVSGSGEMKEFKAGKLLCERTNKSKVLNNVDLTLKGRYTFNGSGDWEYINQDKKKRTIRFTELGTDSSRCIYAVMNMNPTDKFELNDGITYKGKIYLYSKKKDFFYNGYATLTADTTYMKYQWLKVKSFLTADDVRIPVAADNTNDKGGHTYNGIFLNVDKTVRSYAAFLGKRIFYNDELLIGGQGKLLWNSKEKKYIIRDTSIDRYYQMTYNPQESTLSAFGKLNIGLQMPGIVQRASGNIAYNFKEETLDMEGILYLLNFELPGKLPAILTGDFENKTKKTITTNPVLYSKLSGIYGKIAAPDVDKRLKSANGNLPDSLGTTFVLDNLHIKWDAKKRSYVSIGKVNVLGVQKKPVEEEYSICMESVRRRAGNELYVYLYNDEKWYYFEYTAQSLYTLSSNSEYNDALRNEKADKKVIKNNDKETLYTVTLCPDSKKERFLKRCNSGQ